MLGMSLQSYANVTELRAKAEKGPMQGFFIASFGLDGIALRPYGSSQDIVCLIQ